MDKEILKQNIQAVLGVFHKKNKNNNNVSSSKFNVITPLATKEETKPLGVYVINNNNNISSSLSSVNDITTGGCYYDIEQIKRIEETKGKATERDLDDCMFNENNPIGNTGIHQGHQIPTWISSRFKK